jgi:hypothetical protein
MRLLLIVTVAIFYCGNSYAGYSSNDYISDCTSVLEFRKVNDNESESDIEKLKRCKFYTLSAIETVIAMHGINQELKKENIICLPDNISEFKVSTMVVGFYHEHPELLDYNPASIMVLLFNKRYPCK